MYCCWFLFSSHVQLCCFLFSLPSYTFTSYSLFLGAFCSRLRVAVRSSSLSYFFVFASICHSHCGLNYSNVFCSFRRMSRATWTSPTTLPRTSSSRPTIWTTTLRGCDRKLQHPIRFCHKRIIIIFILESLCVHMHFVCALVRVEHAAVFPFSAVNPTNQQQYAWTSATAIVTNRSTT